MGRFVQASATRVGLAGFITMACAAVITAFGVAHFGMAQAQTINQASSVSTPLPASGQTSAVLTVPQNQPQVDLVLEPRVTLDKPQILPMPSAQTVFALVALEAKQLDQDEAPSQPKMNIALVLDQSGSMAEAGKLDYAKRAANDFVSRLGEQDRIALVSFSSDVTLLAKSGPPNVDRLSRIINALEPDNATNISGGLDLAADQVMRQLEPNGINRLILLSDGLANRGIQDRAGIAAFARDLRQSGLTISAMGLGADYDEDFLSDIALAGSGNYHFIESPAQMARVFDQEIRALQSTRAKQVELRFDLSSQYVQSAKLFALEEQDLSKLADLGAFFAGEQRAYIIKLEVQADTLGAIDLGSMQVSYVDPATGLRRSQDVPLGLEVVEADQPLQADMNVAEQVALMRVAQVEQQALKLAREQGANSAADYLAVQAEALEASVPRSAAVLNKLDGLSLQQEEYQALPSQSVSEQKLYLKGRQSMGVSALKGKAARDIMQVGSSGFDVERLQGALRAQGFDVVGPDGTFDDSTRSAIEAYQRQQGLNADGVAGPRTLKALGLR